MAILITNDDGIESVGIQLLREALSEVDTTYLIAPMGERSACSHSIQLGKPIRLQRIDSHTFALNGTPADCVRAGIMALAEEPVDLVVSGINRGANAGYDVHYSGTVAGAREGAIQGKLGVAFSLYDYTTDIRFPMAAQIAKTVVLALRDAKYDGNERGIFLNVNIPNVDSPKDLEITRLGTRLYRDEAHVEFADAGHETIKFVGSYPEGDTTPGTDIAVLDAGKVSVTPLSLLYAEPNESLGFIKDWYHDRELNAQDTVR